MNRVAVLILCGFTTALAAQQPATLSFEVASIKRNTTGGFAMSSQPSGRFVATNVPVID